METVRVIYHCEPEGWWAESPDMEGWSVAGASYAEVRTLVDGGVEVVLGRSEIAVEHFVPVDAALSA